MQKPDDQPNLAAGSGANAAGGGADMEYREKDLFNLVNR